MARNKYPEETIKLILAVSRRLFCEKGYENTSIQDIVDNLGGLSKGAIYHHFKSKEEIFAAVCDQIGQENVAYYDGILANKGSSGLEKLRAIFRSAYANPNNDMVVAMADKLVSDPKFLVNIIKENYELVAPLYIEPAIRQGMADGSIKTDHPKQLAEVIITLLNIWLNPMVNVPEPGDIVRRVEFFDNMLCSMGLPIFDQEIKAQCISYCEKYNSVK